MTKKIDNSANALPSKRFFVNLITRDITLEHSVLDLIDNAIDSMIRTYGVDLKDNKAVFRGSYEYTDPPKANFKATINISVSSDEFTISDNCGGIDPQLAKLSVFRFGPESERRGATLGVYGIGLKRAIFKLGKTISIESVTTQGGFRVEFDAVKWLDREKKVEDWVFPYEEIDGVSTREEAGTTIRIVNLRPDSKMRIEAPTFINDLYDTIARTYPFFLNQLIQVKLNGAEVQSEPMVIGTSDNIEPAVRHFSRDNVDVFIAAAITSVKPSKTKDAGWYIVCNGRVVIAANKSELTGWGRGIAAYHQKYSEFLGYVIFSSEDAEALPWTTTKTDINEELPVYQYTRKEMDQVASGVLRVLNKKYPTNTSVDPEGRQMSADAQPTNLGDVAEKDDQPFKYQSLVQSREKTTTTSTFEADKNDLARAKKHLGWPKNTAAYKVVQYAWQYFLQMECQDK